MIAKLAFIFIASACLAVPFPGEEQTPSNVAAVPPQNVPYPIPLLPPEVQQQGATVPAAETKPDESDLNTANSHWNTKTYYPVYYTRSYYKPVKTYTTYTHYTPYISTVSHDIHDVPDHIHHW